MGGGLGDSGNAQKKTFFFNCCLPLVGTNLLQSAVQKYVMCVPHQKVSMKLKFPELKEKWQVVKLDMILVSLKSCLAKFDLFILAKLQSNIKLNAPLLKLWIAPRKIHLTAFAP